MNHVSKMGPWWNIRVQPFPWKKLINALNGVKIFTACKAYKPATNTQFSDGYTVLKYVHKKYRKVVAAGLSYACDIDTLSSMLNEYTSHIYISTFKATITNANIT